MGKQAKLKKLRRQQQEVKVEAKNRSREKLWTILACSATILSISFLAWTILKPGLPSGHDISAHAIYSKIFTQALGEGQFPVRWVELPSGLSFPLFNFYQVGFYYLVSLVHFLIPSLTWSIKVTLLLLWWLGAGFIFLYTRRFGNIPAGLAALIYTFTPYLILDLFVRASYPEFTAITFSMGVLWALDRLLGTAKPLFVLPLSLFLAITLFSHLPTMVILGPIFLLYTILLFMTQEAKTKGLLLALASAVLGVGLASFYLLPAIFELNLIKSSLLTGGYYDFHPHFVYSQQLFSTFWGYGISQEGANDGISFQFGWLQWLIVGITILLLFWPKLLKNKSLKPILIFWLLILSYSLFFMHNISLSFWENIPGLSFIQYPWRFLMVVPVSTAILAAYLLNLIPKDWLKATLVLLLIPTLFLLYGFYLKPAVFLPQDYFNLDSTTWRQSEGAKKAYLEEGYLPKEVEQLPEAKDLKLWTLPQNSTVQVEPKIQQSAHLLLLTQSTKASQIQLNIPYFPGWKALLDNQETEVNHQNPEDFMRIDLPAGSHQLEAIFTNTFIRTAANLISIISIVILFIWLIFSLKSQK